MKERPILFNAPMVRAILEGRKTQARRVCKQAEAADLSHVVGPFDCPEFGPGHFGDEEGNLQFRCPYGQPGDRLWVRETWQGPLVEQERFDAFKRDRRQFETPEFCQYAADGGPRPEFVDMDDNMRYCWRPSIHMPRWASRILLEIVSVRVERLNDISEADAVAEGVERWKVGPDNWWVDYSFTEEEAEAGVPPALSATESYRTLWESINGPGSWDDNPYVWAIEFRRIEQ